jgi:2-C-methyl-D-erythritol 4-phosphate cytidylyltransferase
LKVVVAITSPVASQKLTNETILRICIQTALSYVAQYGAAAHLAIAGTEQDLFEVSDLTCEKIVCNPNASKEFAHALQRATPAEIVMIHDSQRALTKLAQFDRVFNALTPDVDAIRPVCAFTESLKSITSEHFVSGAIDRGSMMSVSTPQLIRSSAIDSNASATSWFVPLRSGAEIANVMADPDSARINSEKEIPLMQNLLNTN